ncbi:alpha-D-xyloside xylohydrolase [Cladophialophora psammophila CBS 110553]|uniref:Alpha-D-xyloside xylohydrolase n=1 Tax=Cladophialophora psammophila CBS 110553 TaxID=1182543 RepID=W9WX08_9EURO|nr:alpha-D-xyloside xylohydrolase [Cladophialophora psammophila CBS 110553]EXJ72742.1 alpha-D-xyloside xylohydrolase [Cladophialophora psammophila CBS 110553]
MLLSKDDALHYTYDSEHVQIEAWGPNALRVRATKFHTLPSENWALTVTPPKTNVSISMQDGHASINNGNICATVSSRGKIVIKNTKGELLLEEYQRNRSDVEDPKCSALMIEAREFKPLLGGDYHLTYRLESVDRNEKIYGMGQYQQPFLDLKGLDLEMAQRNSQASVPFMLSNLGYGMLWNNPAVGRAVLGKNTMSFEAYSTRVLDYWVVSCDTPAQIIETYADITGKVPMMPEYGLGFWQCKLRYQTQEELLNVAREYRRRNLPLDVIVVDFFHWPKQGEWKFDPTYWKDPDDMIKELQSMNIELLISIWPTVDKRSENYDHMLENGLLIRQDRGLRISMDFQGETVHADFTNPATRDFVWKTVKKNYYDKGVKLFWLDEAEPEYSAYDFDIYRYYSGSVLSTGNAYPVEYAKTFYEGMVKDGKQQDVCNLIRCAWAGSQKFGTLLWSGDIASSWESFRDQFAAGLNVGIAGIPWWTTDIGECGFHGGNPKHPEFRELCARWFQYGCFCPVFRLHGDREPKQPQHGTTGGATCLSGAPNEIWCYGEECYQIMKKYLFLRERLRPYIRDLMAQAHNKGMPVIRTLFLEFPDDKECWEVEDQYMFGHKYLVAPVMYKGMTRREVYLPRGTKWKRFDDGEVQDVQVLEGGKKVEVDCPLAVMPVFERV